jgi:two-component system NtrC family response regulator
VKGAFTDAKADRAGRFELADGGTLFLDEIGDLPRGTQVKLLRVLQEQAFERLGGSRTLKVDVRVIAATHRDLPAMARAGEFREDLLFRLNVFPITLPPLRERREDIPLLVDLFLRRFADEGRARSVSREAMDLLLKHDYPGNVRELENLVHRAVVLARGELVGTADLPLHLGVLRTEDKGETGGFTQRVEAFEKRLILEALDREGGVQTRAAASLGISERHLRYKLKKYGL